MARRRRTTSLGDFDIDSTDSFERAPTRRQRVRRRRFPLLLVLVLVLAGLVLFAPQLATQTAMKDRLIQWVLPPGAAQVQVQQASASWWSPVTLRNVEVFDVDGQPMISVEQIITEKRLIDLATNYRALGTIHASHPRLNLVVTKQGSNLQRALATFQPESKPATASATTSSPVSLGLEITGGHIDVIDQVSGSQSTAANVDLSLFVPAANESELVVKLTADTTQGHRAGSLQAEVRWQPPPELTASDLGVGQVVLKSDRFPLPILTPLLSRTVPDLRLDGQMDTELTCSWANQAEGPALQAAGSLGIANGIFAMASLLGNDELKSQHAAAQIEASISHSQVDIRRLQTDSEFGQLVVTGSAPLSELVAEDVFAQLASSSSRHELQAEGQVNLAQLARALPETLRLRQGTNITEGTLDVNASSRNPGGARQLSAVVKASTLEGVANGQPIRWDRPVELNLVAKPVGQKWLIERLEATAQFLRVLASGDATNGQFQATGDLDLMLSELRKFSDVGDLQLAGSFESDGNWQTNAGGQVAGNATANVQRFTMSYAGMQPWHENQMNLKGAFEGQVREHAIQQISTASAELVSGGDQLQVVLTQPVAQPSLESQWPARAALRGNIETWLARLQPWITLGEWNIAGAIDASATGIASTTEISLEPIEANLTDVRAVSGNQVVVDPQVKVSGTARWSQAEKRVTIPSATVSSSTLAMRGQDIDVSLAPESFRATGTTSFRTDLQRLWSWVADPQQPSTTVPQGLATGTVQLSTTGNQVRFSGDAKVTDLVVNSWSPASQSSPGAWNRSWHEAQLTVNAHGTFDQPVDLLHLEKLDVISEAVQLAAKGKIEKLATAPYADLSGQLQYDWQRMLDKIREQVGPQVQIAGQHRQPFVVRGPLTSGAVAARNPAFPGQPPRMIKPTVPPELTAQVALAWDQANMYGITVGPQEIKARLEQGTIFTEPISLALRSNGGSGTPQSASVTMAPRVELNSQPMMLLLDQTTAAENIELTPELCSHWLKYIAPLVAGTATASGSLSANLAGARIPLTNPVAADIAGQVTIHQAKVSPGPMAQQLLSISQQVGSIVQKNPSKLAFLEADKTWLDIQQQQVEFQMGGGRVYHRNLEFHLGEATVQSHGWVGLDQTIALEANIPILDKWIGDEKLLAGMRGKSVQIPIRGTFSRPQLDQRALANISQQLIGSTAEQFIQGELQKGLQKLLGPK